MGIGGKGNRSARRSLRELCRQVGCARRGGQLVHGLKAREPEMSSVEVLKMWGSVR